MVDSRGVARSNKVGWTIRGGVCDKAGAPEGDQLTQLYLVSGGLKTSI